MELISCSQFALMLHMVPYLGPIGITKLITAAKNKNDGYIDLDDLSVWNMSADSLKNEFSINKNAANCIVNNKNKLLNDSKSLFNIIKQLGISVISILDDDYPSLISDYLKMPPPVLYVHGNLSLLREKKFAVVSSSDITPLGVEKTRQVSSILADNGMPVITSHNTYPYQISGLAAKSRNASIILVLDRGMLNVFPKGMGWEPVKQARIWNLRFDTTKDLVISPFRLYDHWIGNNSKERDKLVFALADIVVGIEIRAGGVMESECMMAEKMGREVYVFKPDAGIAAGNEYLIGNGIKPIPSSWVASYLQTLDLPDDAIEYEF